jgi:hypothetical protein
MLTPVEFADNWRQTNQPHPHAQVDEQPRPLLAKHRAEHDGEHGHGGEQRETLGPPLVGHAGQDPEHPQVHGGEGHQAPGREDRRTSGEPAAGQVGEREHQQQEGTARAQQPSTGRVVGAEQREPRAVGRSLGLAHLVTVALSRSRPTPCGAAGSRPRR